jgi:hypothetical protein
MRGFSIWHFLVLLIYLAVFVVPCWKIVSKAGYSGAWSLLALVPFVNIIMLWVFAFSSWPITKESR